MDEYREVDLVNTQRFESVKKQYNTWRKCFFSAMSQVYKQPAFEVPQSMRGKMAFYGLNVLILWNTAAIIWTHNISINQWQNYRVLWLIFEFCRIDVICAELYSPTSCIIGSYAFLFAILALIMLVYISELCFKANFKYIICFLSILLYLAEILNMPLFILLSLTLKYSWTHAAPSEYYQTSISMDLSSLGILLSLLCMCILTVVGYCRITFDYDCRHSHANSSIRGKAYSRIELNSLLCNYFSIILYTFVSPTSFVAYRLAMIGIHGSTAMMYYHYLPYFNFYANFARSSCNIFACVSCLLMLISYAVKNAVFCIYGLCLILPLTLSIWYAFMVDGEKKAAGRELKFIKDIWEFEIIVRKEMINYNENTVNQTAEKFKMFGRENSCRKGKHLLIWEVAHKYYACKHEQAAFFILSRDLEEENTLEEEYQEYILRKEISNKIYQQYGEYKFTTQIDQYEKIKAKDKIACILVLEYYFTIAEAKSSLDSFERDGSKLKLHLEKVKRVYSSLISEFSNSILILDLYSSFILSIYNDVHKYSNLNFMKKALAELRNNAQASKNSIFLEENPYFLISASDSDIGHVLFSNPSMLSLLHHPIGTITNKQMSHYFPKDYKFFKPEALRQFKIALIDCTTYIEESMAILDANELLVEISLTMIMFGSIKPLFLCICIPIITTRAVILINNKGLIQYHSENLTKLLEIEDKTNDRDITSILPTINLKKLKRKENFVVNINNSKVSIIYTKTQIKSKSIRYLHLYPIERISKRVAFHNEIKLDDVPNKKFECISTDIGTSVLSDEGTSFFTNTTPLNAEQKQEAKKAFSQKFVHRIDAYKNSSSRLLKLLKAILFAAVNTMQILIIVVSNSIILGFLAYNINSILAQESINILGSTIYFLTNIGTDSPAIQVLIYLSPADIPARMELFLESVTALSDLRNNFTEYNSDWGKCEISQSLFEKSIPVTMMINGTNEIVYLTMVDYLDLMLTAVIFI